MDDDIVVDEDPRQLAQHIATALKDLDKLVFFSEPFPTKAEWLIEYLETYANESFSSNPARTESTEKPIQ